MRARIQVQSDVPNARLGKRRESRRASKALVSEFGEESR